MAAPSLSTHQDEITFARVEQNIKRPHLGLVNASEAQVKAKILDYYSVDEIVDFLQHNHYRNITLQFPDELVCDSATLAHELQRRLNGETSTRAEGCASDGKEMAECCSKSDEKTACCSNSTSSSCGKESTAHAVTSIYKIWILADTSYSPCCIDEVAAEHVHSDLVIHFGDACLNGVDKLASVYVFGKPAIDEDDVCRKIEEQFESSQNIMLMANAPYTRYLRSIHSRLKESYPNIEYMDIPDDAQIIGYEGKPGEQQLNRIVPENIDLADYELVHICKPGAPRLLQLTTKFSSVVVYEPSEKKIISGPFPNLMRRYRYMNVARSAGTVGILVNTLSLRNTKKMIDTLAKQLKDAGKKHYLFVVGKPNVAKLANFEEIDIWVILGCDNQGIIVDEHNEFFKPIITPYELVLALSNELTWTGQWETQFESVLDVCEPTEQKVHSENESDEEPTFDPVTGRFATNARPLRQINHLSVTHEEESDESALVKKFSSHVAVKNTVSTAAQHLQGRTWTGLGSDYKDNEEGAVLEEGRGGIARGYNEAK